MKELTYTEAVLEAFREEMQRDEKVFHLCGGLGPLASLIPEFGEERVRVCPISEDAYVGASIGAAGIPHAGTVMMVVVLSAVGLPIDYVGLILAVDRVLDMYRTSINVWSDSTACAVVARFERAEPH